MLRRRIRQEGQNLGDDVFFRQRHLVPDDLARPARHIDRHGGDARTHGRHLRPVVERIDRAEQRAAEGRPRRRKRPVGVDLELRAIGRQSGQKRRRDGAGEIAAEIGRTEKQDFRLIFIDEFRGDIGEGLVAIFGERFVLDDIADVGAIGEAIGDRLLSAARRPEHDAAKIDLELVRELAALAHQLPRHGMHNAAFELDQDPNVLIALEMLGQLFLRRGTTATGSRGRGRGSLIVHCGRPYFLNNLRPSSTDLFRALAVASRLRRSARRKSASMDLSSTSI